MTDLSAVNGNTSSDLNLQEQKKTSPEKISQQAINYFNAPNISNKNKSTNLALGNIANGISKKTVIQNILDMIISPASAESKVKANKTNTPIPGAPLYHLLNAKNGSHDSFDRLQNAIDSLDKKAQEKKPFNENEKEFLKELYEAFWYGGTFGGMPEAGKLASQYIDGNGKPLAINSKPYTGSIVVNDTINAMKAHIRDLAANNKSFKSFKTDDADFRKSNYFKPLMKIKGSRDTATQGYVKSDGLMFAEQDNQRLQKVDNRFYLKASTKKLEDGKFQTTWRVDNIYDFEPYPKNNITELPINNNMTLYLPDGLSEYMDTGLGIAKSFKYHAEWGEVWQ